MKLLLAGGTTFPIIDVTGTLQECGQQYGQTAAALIQHNIKAYGKLFQFHANLNREAALQKAEQLIPAIEATNPDLIVEMQGVADGAGVSLNEIVMLNARTELLATVPLRECTSIAALPPATSGDVWLAQNWDWLHITHSSICILKISQPNKPKIMMVVEAGQIGKMGMNDAGLGLCLNWLQADHQRVGVPVLLLCREILNSAHLDTAINAIYLAKRASAANFLIAYKEPFAIDLETTPNDVDFLEPSGGILIHTNHFITRRFRAIDNGLRDAGGSSLIRRQRAQYRLEQESTVDIDAINRTLDDTICGAPSCFLSPRRQRHKLDQSLTLARISMNLSTGEMHVSDQYANVTSK
jgi:isopenicillin-N N-acyltransferase like protein